MADSAEQTCMSCGRPQSELGISLKTCAKCHSSFYCSRECQKADWKNHKRSCKTTSGERPSRSDSHAQIPGPGGRPMDINDFTTGPSGSFNTNPFQALTDGSYLHNIPEQEAYRNLINSYRLRVTDEYNFSDTKKEFSRYTDNPQPLRGFQRYLDRVEAKNGLCPPWWTSDKRQACETLAADQSQWSCIYKPTEKHDIINHYHDSMKPMQLRMFAEKVEGWNVDGTSSGAQTASLLASLGGS